MTLQIEKSDKSALRQKMLTARAALAPVVRAEQSYCITQRILREDIFQRAQTVFCYCSYEDEIDTYGIMQEALAQGKRLCVPKTFGGGCMQACIVHDLQKLKKGRYGIPEPDETCTVLEPAEIDLCIVPCLAADYSGGRLGYGGGYYDRYLPRTNAQSIVLCADARLYKQLAVQEHDYICDVIITEERVVYRNEA